MDRRFGLRVLSITAIGPNGVTFHADHLDGGSTQLTTRSGSTGGPGGTIDIQATIVNGTAAVIELAAG